MRIKQLQVARYGPMAPFSAADLGRFCVVHGPNEQGKTLLIDALIRLLFKSELKKSHVRRFGNMGRVEEQPEGFVVLELDGAERKLESKESITDVTGITLTPEDFRNVFVVRDSDLGTHDGRAYYAGVTERLTGVRTREIDALLRTIQDLGRLRSATPDSRLSNRADDDKLADKFEEARKLAGEIEEERARLVAEGYDRLESDLVDARREIDRLEEEKHRLDAVEAKRKLLNARGVLDELRRVEKAAEELARLTDEEAIRWQTLSVGLEREVQRVHDERSELEKLRSECKAAGEELERLRARVEQEDARLRALTAALSPSLDALDAARARVASGRGGSGFNRRAMWAAVLVSALGMIGYTVAPGLAPGLVATAALAAAAFFFTGVRRHHRAVGEIDVLSTRVVDDARRHGVTAASVDEAVAHTDRMRSALETLESQRRAQQANVDVASGQIAHGEKRVDAAVANIEEMEREVADLQARSGMASLEDYQKAISYRRELEASSRAKRELLTGLLGAPDPGDDALPVWGKTLEEGLRRYESVQLTESDEGARERAHSALEEKKVTARELDAKLRAGKERLHSIEVRATEIGLLDETPPCRTTHELEHLGGELAAACDEIEGHQFIAQRAIEFFLAIQEEEQEKVGELFGADSPVSDTFFSITGGRYRAVHYDAGSDRIVVEDAGGARLDASALSGGAYDQLYLSIRLTIAQRLLGGKPGFFIMDDPFIKADRQRLRAQLDVLRRLVSRGWQVLYFSAKEEVLRALQDEIATGLVKRLDLQRSSAVSLARSATVDDDDDPSQMPLFN